MCPCVPLTENPVLCDDNLPELVAAMEMQQARLIGIAHCIVPQQIMDPSIMMQPPMSLQKMLKPQSIAVAPNLLQPLQPPPSIVQIIYPAIPVQELLSLNNATTTTSTTTTTTEAVPIVSTSTLSPQEPEIILMQKDEEMQKHKQNESAEDSADENDEDSQKEENNETIDPAEHVVAIAAEPEEVSSTTVRQSMTADLIGNVIHEVPKDMFSVYSPMPEVLQPIERQQALSAEPENPPEDVPDEDDDLTQ